MKRRRSFSLINLMSQLFVFLLVCYVGIVVVRNNDDTTYTHVQTTLESAGYTQVTLAGYQWWGCTRNDVVHLKFSAKGPTGIPTRGVVCGGLWGGYTIRH